MSRIEFKQVCKRYAPNVPLTINNANLVIEDIDHEAVQADPQGLSEGLPEGPAPCQTLRQAAWIPLEQVGRFFGMEHSMDGFLPESIHQVPPAGGWAEVGTDAKDHGASIAESSDCAAGEWGGALPMGPVRMGARTILSARLMIVRKKQTELGFVVIRDTPVVTPCTGSGTNTATVPSGPWLLILMPRTPLMKERAHA